MKTSAFWTTCKEHIKPLEMILTPTVKRSTDSVGASMDKNMLERTEDNLATKVSKTKAKRSDTMLRTTCDIAYAGAHNRNGF